MLTLSLAYSQETNQTKLFRFKSASLTPLEIYFDKSTGGLSFTGDVSYAYQEHIFTLSGTVGSELTFVGGVGDGFEQLNLLYGREFTLSKIVFIDVHGGLGYFSFKPGRRDLERSTQIGIPLVAKLRFKMGSVFSMGMKLQANINSANNIYTIAALNLQWNRRN